MVVGAITGVAGFNPLPPEHPAPDAVLFDMDGLLFDSEAHYRSLFLTMLGEDGYAGEDHHFLQLVGRGWKETIGVLDKDFPGLDGADFVARWKAACDPAAGLLPALKPGVLPLLDWLEARGTAVAIATGSERAVAHGFCDRHGLRARFGAIVAHEDVARGKPHPEPFLTAAAALGVAPEHCLALEDSPNGVRSAAAAGIPVVFVPDLIAPTEEIRRLSLGVANDLVAVRDWLAALD